MSPDRLKNLVQISSERDIANSTQLSKLVDIFKHLPNPVSFPVNSILSIGSHIGPGLTNECT